MSTLPRTHTRIGRFIAVVGPSGAGKDSVMDGLCAHVPDVHRVRRVVTRAADAGGEVHVTATPDSFAALKAKGAFALDWTAHGLSYGIPMSVHGPLQQGRDVLANLSRGAVRSAMQAFCQVVVLHITAPQDVLSRRVAERARETDEEAQRRLSRKGPPMPEGVQIICVDNAGPLDQSVAAALAVLYPERV